MLGIPPIIISYLYRKILFFCKCELVLQQIGNLFQHWPEYCFELLANGTSVLLL